LSGTLDLSGVPCPQNSARALLHLDGLEPGAELVVILDDGLPIRNVPPALAAEGHQELSREQVAGRWRLRVKRGS